MASLHAIIYSMCVCIYAFRPFCDKLSVQFGVF